MSFEPTTIYDEILRDLADDAEERDYRRRLRGEDEVADEKKEGTQ